MKIGIITMHRVVNYGSFLQAYGLMSILKDYGHDCQLIDIRPGKEIVCESNKLLRKITNIFTIGIDTYLKSRRFNVARKKKIDDCLRNILYVDEIKYDTSLFDMIIVGSDEVFNVLQHSPWGFSRQLLGEIECANKITYAASFGNTDMEKISKYNVKEEMSILLKNYDAISVRDANSNRIIKELTGIIPTENMDPVLMYEFADEIDETFKIEKKYIVVYGYNNRIRDKATIEMIRTYAKKHDLLLISVGNYQSWCDKKIACTPFELLGLFKKAECIITDTFHGTVISIKYAKRFATIVRNSNANKLTDLLTKFNLENHICTKPEALPEILNIKVDMNRIAGIVDAERERTREYFAQNRICQ